MQATDSTSDVPVAERDRPSDSHGLKNAATVCVVFFVLGFVVCFGYSLWQVSQRDVAGQSAPNDISVFSAAAKLALADGRIGSSPRGFALGTVVTLVRAAPTLGHFGREAGVDHAFAIITPPILTASLLAILREIALARADARR